MPKFYKQNKKRIDPRYFLEETVNRETSLEEGFMDVVDDHSKYRDQPLDTDAGFQADPHSSKKMMPGGQHPEIPGLFGRLVNKLKGSFSDPDFQEGYAAGMNKPEYSHPKLHRDPLFSAGFYHAISISSGLTAQASRGQMDYDDSGNDRPESVTDPRQYNEE